MRKLISKLTRHHWDLAFVEPVEGNWLTGNWQYKFVKRKATKQWFADPFILDVTDDTIILLVEEFTYTIKRGRIAKLTIDRKTMKITEIKIILDLPTHLSFPAILRYKGEVYIYPENNESGALKLYKYNTVDDSLQLVSSLVEEPLTDAIIVTDFSEPFIFSTIMTDARGNGSTVYVYKADSVLGKYEMTSKVELPERIARSAGALFCLDNRIIRSAQLFDGEKYGAGLSFQEVAFDGSAFMLKEVRRMLPFKGYTGMHTFNLYKGVAVVDCSAKNHPFLGPKVKYLMDVARRLFKR